MENKITNLPEKIYLNLGELTDDATDFTDLEEVTWSPETVDHNDPCYVHESALQALDTALTEKHRAEVEGLRDYLEHHPPCYKYFNKIAGHQDSIECTCGLDQLLTNQPASGKGGTDES